MARGDHQCQLVAGRALDRQQGIVDLTLDEADVNGGGM